MSEAKPYPIDNLWKRGGFYVARLTGPDPKYGIGREFLQGKPIKSSGTLEYSPGHIGDLPAWIVRSGGTCSGCGRPDPKAVELIAARAMDWIVVGGGFTTADLIAVWESGLPGDNPETQVTEALDDRVPVYAADKEDPF